MFVYFVFKIRKDYKDFLDELKEFIGLSKKLIGRFLEFFFFIKIVCLVMVNMELDLFDDENYDVIDDEDISDNDDVSDNDDFSDNNDVSDNDDDNFNDEEMNNYNYDYDD